MDGFIVSEFYVMTGICQAVTELGLIWVGSTGKSKCLEKVSARGVKPGQFLEAGQWLLSRRKEFVRWAQTVL